MWQVLIDFNVVRKGVVQVDHFSVMVADFFFFRKIGWIREGDLKLN